MIVAEIIAGLIAGGLLWQGDTTEAGYLGMGIIALAGNIVEQD